MKININRLCTLAGVPVQESRSLNEASNRSYHDDASLADEAEYRFGANQLAEEKHADEGHGGMYMHEKEDADEGMYKGLDEEEAEEGMHYEGAHDADEGAHDADEAMHLDEVIEVDERMLVQELRRAKKLIQQSKRRKTARINESRELKRIIREELSDMLDLNLTSEWIYGKDKPKRSKSGYVNHGSFMPGYGFKK